MHQIFGITLEAIRRLMDSSQVSFWPSDFFFSNQPGVIPVRTLSIKDLLQHEVTDYTAWWLSCDSQQLEAVS